MVTKPVCYSSLVFAAHETARAILRDSPRGPDAGKIRAWDMPGRVKTKRPFWTRTGTLMPRKWTPDDKFNRVLRTHDFCHPMDTINAGVIGIYFFTMTLSPKDDNSFCTQDDNKSSNVNALRSLGITGFVRCSQAAASQIAAAVTPAPAIWL